MSDPLADLLGQIERETFGTSMGPLTLKRWAVALAANRDRLLEALGGEAIGWAHDCCGGQVRSEQPGICGYPWCGDALGSGPVWLFPLGEDK